MLCVSGAKHLIYRMQDLSPHEVNVTVLNMKIMGHCWSELSEIPLMGHNSHWHPTPKPWVCWPLCSSQCCFSSSCHSLGGSDLHGSISRKLVQEVVFSEAANLHRIRRRWFQRLNCPFGYRCSYSQAGYTARPWSRCLERAQRMCPAEINLGTFSLGCIKFPR